jgi:hypothetical protein
MITPTAEQNGLRAAAGITIAFGLLIALSALPALNLPMRLLADLLLWPLDGGQPLTAPDTRLMLAIGGGVMAGWGVMIWQLAGAPFARAPEETRRIILTSVLVWFTVDSTASVLAGATLNAVANLGFLALFLLPMRLGRKALTA